MVRSSSATLTRFRCPPDRLAIRRDSWGSRSSSSEHLGHAAHALGPVDVGRETKIGRILERFPHRELLVDDVVLRDVADSPPQRVVAPVEAAVVVKHVSLGGRRQTGEGPEQRRFPRPGGADHAEHRARVEGELDAVDEHFAARQAHGQAGRREGDLPGVHVFLEHSCREPVRVGAHHDHVVLGEHGALDAAAVYERAVVAVEVDDLDRSFRAPPKLRVPPRHEQVVHDQVAVGVASDAEDVDLDRVTTAWARCTRTSGDRPEVGGRKPCRVFLCRSDLELSTAVWVTQVQAQDTVDVQPVDRPALVEDSVRDVECLHGPASGAVAEKQVPVADARSGGPDEARSRSADGDLGHPWAEDRRPAVDLDLDSAPIHRDDPTTTTAAGAITPDCLRFAPCRYRKHPKASHWARCSSVVTRSMHAWVRATWALSTGRTTSRPVSPSS